jgi:pyrimidine deaminase RibD-like protein
MPTKRWPKKPLGRPTVHPKAKNQHRRKRSEPDRKPPRAFQEQAVKLALNCKPDSVPPLKVGVVVVRDGKVIASANRGQYREGDHAEFTALERVLVKTGKTAANSDIYVTLEPCTARSVDKIPCAKRLIDHRVKRVYIGAIDPNPKIRGLGIKMLQEHGIEVRLFDHDLVNDLYAMNREFEQYFRERSFPDRVESLTNQPTAQDACVEFLRLENLYMPREFPEALFDRAVVMTDDAGERIGYDVVTLSPDVAPSLLDHIFQVFSSNSPHRKRELRLGRHYLAIVVEGHDVSESHRRAREVQQMCEDLQLEAPIAVFLGWMADNTFVPLVVTNTSTPTGTRATRRRARPKTPKTGIHTNQRARAISHARHEPVRLPAAITTDDELWLLALTARYSAHRELHQARTGGSANSIWIADKPIDFYVSRWLYDLFEKVLKRGLMFSEQGVYRLTPEGERALLDGIENGRKPAEPGHLFSALTGAEEAFPLD